MAEPLTKKPFVIASGPDRLVRVLAANQEDDGFHALTFSETEVQGVAEIDFYHSALVLRSGTEIPVALHYEELERKVYFPDIRNGGPVLDLRDVTGLAARLKTPANTKTEPSPGDRMPDGSVYAGVSPDTGKPMYAMPADVSLTMTFNEAAEYTKITNHQKAYGHDDWRVPTKHELNVLFNNRAAIGGFGESIYDDWHWSSSSEKTGERWAQRFRDGSKECNGNGLLHSSVRLVR